MVVSIPSGYAVGAFGWLLVASCWLLVASCAGGLWERAFKGGYF